MSERKPFGEHVNCPHDPEGADGNPFAAMVCAPMSELPASADLAAAERERDEAINNFEETYADLAQARYELKQARSDLADERKAFAASQQDLTRMEEERDKAEAEVGRLRGFWQECSRHRNEILAELASARRELQALRARDDESADAMRRFLDALGINPDNRPIMAARSIRAELDELRKQNETMRIQLAATVEFASAFQPDERPWQVAQQEAGVTCTACSQPIVRGQAFQPLADAKGFFSHAACPIPEQETTGD